MTYLPAYSGLGRRCPKCGADGIRTEWHLSSKRAQAGQRVPCNAPCDDLRDESEHLCRGCGNCDCGWAEACAGNDTGQPSPVPSGEETEKCPG
jgi:hypothetical protein